MTAWVSRQAFTAKISSRILEAGTGVQGSGGDADEGGRSMKIPK